MRIGTIGLGKMGILHSGILNSLHDCSLAAVADPQTLVRKYFSQCCPKVKTYASYHDLLQKEDIDIAVIATPTFLHSEIGRECAKSGVSFLVEKPLGTTLEDAHDLLESVRNTSVATEVGYACVRFVNTFQKGYEVFQSYALGHLRELQATAFVTQVTKKNDGWQFSKGQSGGGVLNNFASHLIYLLYWYFDKPSSVTSKMQSVFSESVEDIVTGTIDFSRDIPPASLEASWCADGYPMPQFEIRAKGDNGNVKVTDYYVELNLNRAEGSFEAGKTTYYRQDLWEGVEYSLGGPEYCREDRHLIDSVMKNTTTLVDVQVGYDVQKIISAMYQSNAQQGRCDMSW